MNLFPMSEFISRGVSCMNLSPDLRERGLEKTGGREDVKFCVRNDYLSTMRAATNKRSSSVERVAQVAKG